MILLVLRVLILLLPASLLLLGVARTEGKAQLMLALGCAFQFLVCFLSFTSQRSWREPVGPSVITLYLIALGWLWLGASRLDDWYLHLAQAVLLLVPLGAFASQTLTNSGAPALRRARILAQRLADRKDWPAHLAACRDLPEVKAFREALHLDATPALNLLQHPRMAVRVAALAALEYRKNWRPGQAELVLQVAQSSPEPAVRAAAVSALANVEDRLLVEALAHFLRDSSWEVRRSAIEALLWDTTRRWVWMRHEVRRALSDPAHQEDGPLLYEGQLLTPEAVADLTAWASEKGLVALRAAQTLAAHYRKALGEQEDETLIQTIERLVANPQAASVLRVELAGLLLSYGKWGHGLWEKLVDPANPAPLRLLAADALLVQGHSPSALAALHDIARLPNREMALATAELVQRRLGVDLGLPIGQPVPSLQSRQAAEVTRRVMQWASQKDANVLSAS
jgi:HEAT repeat protein